MSQSSKIEWTDATWNPVRGCTKISPGCTHCYASTFAERFRGVPGHPYEQGFDLRLVPEPNENFFAHKREWSKRKDEIIGCYLPAYLPKIMTLKKPVVIVDGFAGPGKFSDYSGDISRLAESRSVFLYVDPFTVEGLIWADLEQIYRGLELGNSVEILLNLNSGSFIRRGLAALKLQLDEMDDENEVPVDVEISETPQIEKLDAVAGGKWLRTDTGAFPGAPMTAVGASCVLGVGRILGGLIWGTAISGSDRFSRVGCGLGGR